MRWTVLRAADARRILSDAHPLAERMRDEYVSTEHLLLAIIQDAAGNPARGVLRAQGIEAASVLEALTSIRGNQRVTSENPEATYEALEKYGRDLTDAARAHIAREGYDTQYGARPLRRDIQGSIENPLAKRLLAGEFKAGDTVRIDVRDGNLALDKGPTQFSPLEVTAGQRSW